MWFRRKKQRDEAASDQQVERRQSVRWCATCRTGHGPFVYLENGKHYCNSCATEARNVMRLRPAGRRADDVKNS